MGCGDRASDRWGGRQHDAGEAHADQHGLGARGGEHADHSHQTEPLQAQFLSAGEVNIIVFMSLL